MQQENKFYIPVYCFNFCFHLTIERCALNLYTHAQYKIKCTIHVMFMLFHKKTVLKIFFVKNLTIQK